MKPLKTTISALAISAMTLGALSGGALMLSSDVVYAKGNDNGNGGGNGGGGKDKGDRGNGNKGSDKSSKKSSKEGGGSSSKKGNGDGFFSFLKKKDKKTTHQIASAQPKAAKLEDKPEKAENRGALARELKGLNAAHANPNALANASPNSMVGKVAAYQTAVNNEGEREVLEGELLLKEEELAALIESYDGRTSEAINADILAKQTELDGLDPIADEAAYNVLAEEIADLNTELGGAVEFETASSTLADDIMGLETQIEDLGPTPEDALAIATDGRELSPEALAELHRLLDLPEPEVEDLGEPEELAATE